MPAVIFRPEDIIISLFNFFPGKEFSADREKLHRAFYDLSKEEPTLFEEFTFNTDKLFPKCEALDQALNNLEFSRYLRKFNPYLDSYQIETVLKSYYAERLASDFSKYSSKLRILSKKLKERLR